MSVRGKQSATLRAHERLELTITPVVSRIRPLLSKELDKDVIVRGESSHEGSALNVVRIPNPKNESEEFSFTFNGVYEMETSQEELFTAEGTKGEAICDSSFLIDSSCTPSQISLSGSRRNDFCIWSNRNWKDTHDERRTENVRERGDPPTSQWYI
jgi:hypothetical protein